MQQAKVCADTVTAVTAGGEDLSAALSAFVGRGCRLVQQTAADARRCRGGAAHAALSFANEAHVLLASVSSMRAVLASMPTRNHEGGQDGGDADGDAGDGGELVAAGVHCTSHASAMMDRLGPFHGCLA